MNSEISAFGEVLLFVLTGALFIGGGLITARLIRPSRPGQEKLETYESGESPIGMAWGRINVRFYLFALFFLLFEVEIIFLFPWAVVFGRQDLNEATSGQWGWFTFFEMFLFVAILFLGLIYAWARGYLNWPKPESRIPSFESPIPSELYEGVNRKYAPKK